MAEESEQLKQFFRKQIDAWAAAKLKRSNVEWANIPAEQREAIAKKAAEIFQDPVVNERVGRVIKAVKEKRAVMQKYIDKGFSEIASADTRVDDIKGIVVKSIVVKNPKTGDTMAMSEDDVKAYTSAGKVVDGMGGPVVSAVGKHIVDLGNTERGALLQLIIHPMHEANSELEKFIKPVPQKKGKARKSEVADADLVPPSVREGLSAVKLADSGAPYGGPKIGVIRQL